MRRPFGLVLRLMIPGDFWDAQILDGGGVGGVFAGGV
jgi:hypothetical protein